MMREKGKKNLKREKSLLTGRLWEGFVEDHVSQRKRTISGVKIEEAMSLGMGNNQYEHIEKVHEKVRDYIADLEWRICKGKV